MKHKGKKTFGLVVFIEPSQNPNKFLSIRGIDGGPRRRQKVDQQMRPGYCESLAKARHNDMLVRRGEPLGEFSVRSNYKLLQGLVATAVCPRCRGADETLDHTFRECPIIVKVWTTLNFTWVLTKASGLPGFPKKAQRSNQGYSVLHQRNRRFCRKGSYQELQDCEMGAPTRSVIKINFDATFDNHRSRSGSGIVARNAAREALVSRSILHDDIWFVFAAKALAFSWAVQTRVEMEIGAYIRNIQQNKERFWSLRFKHAQRMENQLAHILATESLKKGEQIYLEGALPSFGARKMEDEWLRELD
ncbi:hypothetical protein CXB51_004274 [Gossypium anomalum]|uniref:RNase H type-1 domain-containing protein n=1 Tax=Gossypium anomalum TaxID=47600 RepID=A0A8J6DDB1_9ROSI|nr:hypothetical protein CXB51_004274 [Gossypium anomalum]